MMYALKRCMLFFLTATSSLHAMYYITPAEKLSNAARDGDVAAARAALAHGAHVDEQDLFSNTPMHRAVIIGHAKIIELLFKHNAQVDIPNIFGRTPLHMACELGDAHIIDLLLNNGASVDALDDYANTPLHNAAHYGHTQAVLALLKQGARIDAQNHEGETPLIHAAYKLQEQAIALLLESGANASLQEIDGRTVFHATLIDLQEKDRLRGERIVKLLIAHTVQTNNGNSKKRRRSTDASYAIRTNDGQTAYDVAHPGAQLLLANPEKIADDIRQELCQEEFKKIRGKRPVLTWLLNRELRQK